MYTPSFDVSTREGTETGAFARDLARAVGSRRQMVIFDLREPGESVEIRGCYWDGGSKNSFYRLPLPPGCGPATSINGGPVPFGGKNQPDKREPLTNFDCIVSCGTCRGKPSFPVVHILANVFDRHTDGRREGKRW